MQKEEVLADLMDHYGTSILRLAYSYVRNRQTAEDLSQEIFFKCYEKMDTYQGQAKVETWLYRIAVNHCKDYVKSWHYRKVHATSYVANFFTGKQDSAEDQYMYSYESDELLQHILALPIKYKEIILLYYFHELSLKEISEICSLNVNTAKARIVKAKKLLKMQLAERGDLYGQQNS